MSVGLRTLQNIVAIDGGACDDSDDDNNDDKRRYLGDDDNASAWYHIISTLTRTCYNLICYVLHTYANNKYLS